MSGISNIYTHTETIIFYMLFLVGVVLFLILLHMIEAIIEHFANNWETKYTKISDTKNPSLSELHRIRNNIFYYTQSKDIKQAITLKIKSYTTKVKVMDSIMTPQQLYSTNNILWARGLSLSDIATILRLENDIDVETEIFPFLDTAN